MRLINQICFFLLSGAVIFIACVKEYNPFDDVNNVKVLYSTSFANFPQITIFSPETLYIKPLVQEKIDSFSISAHGNIFWTDSTINKNSVPFDQSYQFFVSFKDTGINEIVVSTYLSNTQLSKKITDQIYINSPLSQEPVSFYLGTNCTLSTPGVRGVNVVYNWSFGDNFTISGKNKMQILLLNTTPVKSEKCSLWVSDTLGIHKSPKVPFRVTFHDTVMPKIVYSNFMGLYNHDTIYSGNNSFIFMIEIYDQGHSTVEKTWFNNHPFENCELSKNLYWNVIENFQGVSNNSFMQISIKAKDQYNNINTKDFWLCYDSTLKDNNLALLIVDNLDSESVIDNDHRITGKVHNFSSDSLLLTNVVNNIDTIYEFYIIPPDSGLVTWNWNVALTEGYNNFTIRLQKKNDKSIIIEKLLSVFLSKEITDTTGPTITSIMINDTIPYTGSEMFFQEDSVSISVKAFDVISDVDKIFIDSIELFYEVQAQHWKNNIYIYHDIKMNRLLTIHDSLDNKTMRSLNIFQNTKPKILKNKFIQPMLFVGSEYHDSILLIDMDNDPLTVIYLQNEPWVTAGINLSLTPAYNDTGQGSIIFTVSDGLQNSDTCIWYYAVTEEPISVEFDSITIVESLFDTILAGSNQNYINLSAKNGILPYQYTVILSPVNTVVLDTSADSTLLWTPLLQDTGKYTLIFYIEDTNHTKDTLFHPIYVKPGYR